MRNRIGNTWMAKVIQGICYLHQLHGLTWLGVVASVHSGVYVLSGKVPVQ